jgi:hypothetical protein
MHLLASICYTATCSHQRTPADSISDKLVLKDVVAKNFPPRWYRSLNCFQAMIDVTIAVKMRATAMAYYGHQSLMEPFCVNAAHVGT